MLKFIGVIGARKCSSETSRLAFEAGKEIALSGYGLVCGGMSGVMQAAAEGCKSQNGLTLGIIPGTDSIEANPFIDIVIPTGLGINRNLLIVRSSLGIIAFPGKFGTLSEIAFALQLNIPIVGFNTWDVDKSIIKVHTAKEAVNKIIKKI